ncbi:hypothetical protein BC781_101614 [Sediminitomix flava]|uniref:Uncharacterized protein n=1 Tax=Sediminitomix flava TaxID=379075 RepID=A0A315ZHS2_SEDFL|nr:hypothetical protein BC781_101614 [Sediminitomix flava]
MRQEGLLSFMKELELKMKKRKNVTSVVIKFMLQTLRFNLIFENV